MSISTILAVLDSGSATPNPGQAMCTIPNKSTVTLMTTAAVAAGGIFAGIVLGAWGSPTTLQLQATGIADSLGPAAVKVAQGAGGQVGVNATGSLQLWVSGPVVGIADGFGTVTLTNYQNAYQDPPNPAFGDGSDGSVTFDGTTTILGLVPATKVYTLTRDIFTANCTVNAAVTIIGAGFRIFCAGTLTVAATAIIHNGGGAGGVGSSGTGGTAGTAGAGSSSTTLGGGTAGGAGASGSNTGAAATNVTAAKGFPGGTGIGGAGGGATAGSGGAGGTWTVLPAAAGTFRSLPNALTMTSLGPTGTAYGLLGGGGGGGGSADNADAGGGGGGGGGGNLVVSAYSLVNNGTIHCNGGVGGLGFSTAHDAAGGGGGAGGCLVICTRYTTGSGTATASAGAGGLGVGTYTAGSIGAAGNVVTIAA